MRFVDLKKHSIEFQ